MKVYQYNINEEVEKTILSDLIKEWEKLGYKLLDEPNTFHLVNNIHSHFYHIEIDINNLEYKVYGCDYMNYISATHWVCTVTLEEHILIHKTLQYYRTKGV